MKLVKLDLRNFRQHLSTSIEFSDGVTGIIGSNGAGKTTVLEAIAWALYGSPALRGNNDSVRSKAAEGGSKASAELTFDLGGSLYKVTRRLEGSGTGQASLDIDGRTLRTGTREVNAAITQLLGMDYQAFFTSFFTAQKELKFMADMDGRSRAVAISRMLGYDRLTKARDKANSDRVGLDREINGIELSLCDPKELRERKNEATAALAEAKKLLDEAQGLRKTAEESMARLKPLKEASDQKSKRREELSRRLEMDRAEVRRIEERLILLSAEVKDLRAKKAEFDALKAKVTGFRAEKEELARLTELQRFEGDRQRLAGQIAALDQDLTELRKREHALGDVKEAHIRADAALKAGEALLDETDRKLRQAREERVAKLHSLDARIGQLETHSSQVMQKRAQIEEAGAEGNCPTCERPLADELPTVLANFDAQAAKIASQIQMLRAERASVERDGSPIATIEKQRETVSAQVEQLRTERSSVDRRAEELVSIRRQIDDKSQKSTALKVELEKLPGGFDAQRYQELRKLDEDLQPDYKRGHELKGELERLPKAEEELSGLQEPLAAKQQEIAQCDNALAELEFSEEEHERLGQEFEAASRSLQAALIRIAEEQGRVGRAEAVLGEVEKAEAALKLQLAQLELKRSERLHLKTLADAFDALRADLNSRIRPELQDAASELLSDMTDGRYSAVNIDEEYRATIVDDGEEKPVISGGEDDVLNLALRLAVSQMIADRAGQSFWLLVLDEVFGSLDDVRRDNVVGLLQNLKNRFEQIIVITHVEAIHDMVDNCLWVAFDEKTKTSRLVDRSIDLQPVDVIPGR